jgi:predicted esterase
VPDDRWQRVKQIVAAALERPAAAREAFLREACAGDDGLRREVDSIIDAQREAGEFLSEPPPLAGDEPKAPSLAPGRSLGAYQILAPLGAGGMGEVYRAQDTHLGREVAIKVLPDVFVKDPDRVSRFAREARMLAALNHPHVGAIYGVEDADGALALVLELIEGETLADRLKRGPVPVSEALTMARQVAEALQAAHEKGIVHRDLKPANIKITPGGVVKVLDFGLAKAVSRAQEDEGVSQAITATGLDTVAGHVAGTPPYMSPEQAGGKASDRRTDIWAFGCLLYELLTGKRAFQGVSASDTIAAVVEREPDWKALPSATPASIRELLRRCLYKDAARRVQDIVEARRTIEQAQRGWNRWRVAAIAAATVLVILSIAALGVWSSVRRAQAETERKAAVAEAEHLVDLGRFVDVWRVGRAALRRWPDNPQLDAAIRATSHLVTISTDPPGAEVAFKAYEDVDGEWLSLGTTPLKEVHAPVGQLRWRITKTGFEPLEARLEVGAPAAAAGRPDVDARPIRLRPVGSDPGRMVFVPGGRQDGVELTDYWIDQIEVTNREFKDFIDKGGYQDPRHWAPLGRESPQLLGGEEPRAAFRDRTGRPGPSTWELGTYPEGKGDYPVSGVSWFEAVAYCESTAKSLPTVFHWRKAFGASFFVEVLTLGNFNGRGPEATEQLKEVGPYGTLGMAGNVKEWVWNEFEGQRYILGGAWNEPVYMATYDDARPSLDRAETHGFRCVRESAPSEAAAYAPYGAGSRPVRDFTKEKPVDAAAFEIFRSFYSYDRTPLDPRIEHTEAVEYWRSERVSFAAAYGGERVLANILLPKNAAPPYQAVIWFPGAYALELKSSDRDLVFSYYFDFLPRSGRALVYPVYKGTYERRVPGGYRGSHLRDLVVQWSKDLGRTIDYLESRNDIDRDKIAYYGFSMGADGAVPAVALEPRLKAAILLSGGLGREVRPAEIEPLNFLPRMTAPVLLLGGRNDFYFPVETSQAPLFELLGTPAEHKRHVVFEGAGHVPPRIEVIREILDWLDRYLGPVGGGLTHATPPSPR